METLERILSAGCSVGVLGRKVPVRVLNISESGCLVESLRHIEEGSIGRLWLSFNRERYVDDVLIRRCQRIEGAGHLFHVAGEFVWASPPREGSLRMIAARLQERNGNTAGA
jgi:hypothetical protein